MNPTHIHLLLNHFPIVGTLIGSAILLYSIIKNQTSGKATGAVIIVIMAVIALPVMLTGEPAEHAAKQISGISKATIHDHEEMAEKAIWLMEITGLASLIALVLHKIKSLLTPKAFFVAFLFSFAAFLTMAWTGYSGGKIRHPETSKTFITTEVRGSHSNLQNK